LRGHERKGGALKKGRKERTFEGPDVQRLSERTIYLESLFTIGNGAGSAGRDLGGKGEVGRKGSD